MPRVAFAGFLLAGTLASVAAAVGAQSKGGWVAKAPALLKRTEVAVAPVRAKVYVVGGFHPGLPFLTPAGEECDPVREPWQDRAPLPSGLPHAGIGVVNDRLYVIGGFELSLFSIWSPVTSLYEYDPVADRWMARKSMPTPRGALAVAALAGKLHAVGGYNRDGNTSAHEVYDPATDSWTVRAPMPTARDHHAAAPLNGRFYAIGGRLNRPYSQNLGGTAAYAPATDRWTRKADLPTPRSGITAGVVRHRIYVFGGGAPAGVFHQNRAYHSRSHP